MMNLLKDRSASPARDLSAERREKREKRREKRRAERERDPAAEKSSQKAATQSLFPPGGDLAQYVYDYHTYWYVTHDQVWWYRPDITLWYDSRSGCYYSYDGADYGKKDSNEDRFIEMVGSAALGTA
ncbi:hypothetical protein EMIHUDRAFT_220934 [Emiliania huxleyi CCMP1516]|uniref:OCRE domain-containing protein n=2 Tax=Emiliania huxleyi TaxID=2903 RepID=A0A0D3HZQ5_EMIH1|nr:hypothetical protein EMIHUDRAFT_220934 [Emiliania huxleyi CCMP1516]EOD04490.1 hypothetical protein EMIHUDRAFT_220934 [Emiliania huxleyi CCMP1516]|eukprot:XP_005756919.1 hypothetical protein EMIHUDRAFT_220934 [Emiliania huxleyi CCMP1516]